MSKKRLRAALQSQGFTEKEAAHMTRFSIMDHFPTIMGIGGFAVGVTVGRLWGLL